MAARLTPPAQLGSAPAHRTGGADAGHGGADVSGGRVLVLNATYEPINVCTVRRAVVLLLKEKAEVVERGPGSCAPSTRRCRGRWSSAS